MNSIMVSTLLAAGLLCAGSAAGQTQRVLIYFDNPAQEAADLARGDSSAIPYAVYPVERIVDQKSVERQALLELLHGPTRAEIDTGYSTNLDGLSLNRFILRRGTATVSLKGMLLLKGTLSGPRLRLQVEKTLRQFRKVRRIVLLINGMKDFDSLK